MTEEILNQILEHLQKGRNLILIKNLMSLDENLQTIRKEIIKKIGREDFVNMMKSNRQNQNQLLNNTIAQINYLISQEMTAKQIDDFTQVLEGSIIELAAKKDLLS